LIREAGLVEVPNMARLTRCAILLVLRSKFLAITKEVTTLMTQQNEADILACIGRLMRNFYTCGLTPRVNVALVRPNNMWLTTSIGLVKEHGAAMVYAHREPYITCGATPGTRIGELNMSYWGSVILTNPNLCTALLNLLPDEHLGGDKINKIAMPEDMGEYTELATSSHDGMADSLPDSFAILMHPRDPAWKMRSVFSLTGEFVGDVANSPVHYRLCGWYSQTWGWQKGADVAGVVTPSADKFNIVAFAANQIIGGLNCDMRYLPGTGPVGGIKPRDGITARLTGPIPGTPTEDLAGNNADKNYYGKPQW
jgi:hypothetical protein